MRLSNGQRKNRKLLQPWMHHEAAPNTTKFANALHAIYAAWAIVAGALLAGRSAPQRRARARALLSAQGRAAVDCGRTTACSAEPQRRRLLAHGARPRRQRLARVSAGAPGGGQGGQGGHLDFGCGLGDTSSILRGTLGADADITFVDVYRSERWVGGASTRVVYDGATLALRRWLLRPGGVRAGAAPHPRQRPPWPRSAASPRTCWL